MRFRVTLRSWLCHYEVAQMSRLPESWMPNDVWIHCGQDGLIIQASTLVGNPDISLLFQT